MNSALFFPRLLLSSVNLVLSAVTFLSEGFITAKANPSYDSRSYDQRLQTNYTCRVPFCAFSVSESSSGVLDRLVLEEILDSF